MSYWDCTDRVRENFGGDPNCPRCGKTMTAEDDHGRYRCFSCGYGHDYISGLPTRTPRIPQITLPEGVDDLPDEVKAKIPPLNRLHLSPTKAEKAFFDEAMKEMGIGPKYPSDE